MVFEQTTQELGTLLWHTPRTATFKFTNKGTRDLTILDVRTDCGCTVADWTRTAVAPGGTGTITATTTRTSMSTTITTTTARSATIRSAAATITITTPTRYSSAGAPRR